MPEIELDLSKHVFALTKAQEQYARTAAMIEKGVTPRTIGLMALDAMEHGIESFEEIKPRVGQETDCKAGCAWCCYTPVHVSIPELKVIYDEIHRKHGRYQVNKIAEAAHQAVAIIDDPENKGQPRVLLKLPCPLLTKKNECGVYGRHPLVCAGYNSVNVKDCERGYGKLVSISSEAHQMYVYMGVSTGFARPFLDVGYRKIHIELCHGLSTAFRYPQFFEDWCQQRIDGYTEGWLDDELYGVQDP